GRCRRFSMRVGGRKGRSPHGAKRNAGTAIPDFASLHPGYGTSSFTPHQLPEAPPPPDEPPPPEKLLEDPDELDAYEPADTRRPRRSYMSLSNTLSHSQKPVRVLRCGSR